MLANNNITSYECCLRRGSGKELRACKAKVKVDADMEIVDYVNTHSHAHAPDNTQCEVQLMRASIKRRAEETDETAQQILGHELQVISQQDAVQLASIPTIRRAIRSAKLKKNAVYPLPTSRNFRIPGEYKTPPNGKDFLLHDSGNADPNRILIFGTNRTVQLLIEYRHWFVDGTFKIVPELLFSFIRCIP